MPNFNAIPMQKAVYSALTADLTLMGFISGVYDHVTQHTPFPYLTMGDFTVSDWSTKTNQGTEQVMVLNIWSREAGRTQAATIMERVVFLLHDAALTLVGETLISISFVGSEINLLDDGVTYRAQVRFRAFTQ